MGFRIGRLRAIAAAAALLLPFMGGCAGHCCRARLDSWNDTASRRAIVEFVEAATHKGSGGYIAPEERIAVFDNDGTLWAEQPMYFQLAFAIDRVKALAPRHPEWRTTEPFKSILAGDVNAALAGGEKTVMEILAATHAGMTTEEFRHIVQDWTATAKHPRFDRLYTECVYAPMVEMLDYLRAHGFTTYIVSGGGIEFMRRWAEAAYGIPPEQVIGSSGKTKFEMRPAAGGAPEPALLKLREIGSIDDGPGKPVNINLHIGRRPVIAFGNSDGDLEMLQWTTMTEGPRLGVIIHHTDASREWAYDRGSHIGRLEKALDQAPQRGWIVVDMKEDWERVFAFEKSAD